VTPLAPLLAERIRRFGPITFAEYMRECLYHPVHGYYSQPEARRFSDYVTSVDVHPIFGRLLARQFAEMWQQLDRPHEFLLIESARLRASLQLKTLIYPEGLGERFQVLLQQKSVPNATLTALNPL